jgi:thioesterase domain-containing protein
LIVDGWSIGLLADELLSMLVGEPQLGPVDLQYGDFASWQRAMIEAGAFDADLDYWRSNLEAAPRFTIPTDRPNAQRTDDIAFIRSETLSRDLRDALIAHARRSGQTMFVTACTAIARVLADYADEDEVQIAVPVAGREDQDEERIVGPLLNAVVLRVPVSNSNDIARVEAAVRSASANALKHARAPFALVADAARLSCNHETPLGMQVNFVLQSANIHVQSAESLGRGGVTLVSLPSYTPGALWPLNFFMVERPDGYRISCEADAALFTPATVDRLIAAWRKALEEAATDRPVSIMSAPPQGAPNPRVIALQAEGALTPVFALNIASIYYPLAKRLGPDRPFFDVRLCPSSHERDLPDRYFADIARDAIDLIRSARPHGPYVLFGLCVAGALAVEAARQLRDAGEDVPLVVLADTWRPGYREDMSRLAKFERGWRVRVARWRMDYERFRDGRQTLAYILNTYPFARALRLAHLAAALGLSPPASMEDAGDHELRWFADHLGAAQTRFRPEPYAGKLLILRSREPLEGRLFARDFGWGPFAAGGAEVADCPGEHATMFRDAGAAAIAKIMNRCLSRMSV